jgi:hypothetical protein
VASDGKPPKAAAPTSGDGEKKAKAGIDPAMTLTQIKAAGLMPDLPYEAPDANPPALVYEDLGPEKGWQAPEGFKIAGVPYADAVAGIGGGAEGTSTVPPVPTDGSDGSPQ